MTPNLPRSGQNLGAAAVVALVACVLLLSDYRDPERSSWVNAIFITLCRPCGPGPH